MGVVGRLDQYASMLAGEFDETTANNTSISGLGTYYASEFNENIVEINIVTSGLILNLDAGNVSSYPGSGTTWFDLSGNGNNATLVNGPTYSGVNGGVFNFNGTNQYASSPINVATSNHTIIAIARLTGSGSNGRIIASSSVNYLMGWHGGGTDKYYANGWVYDGGGAALTTWICYAAVGNYSTDSWQLYKNGVALGTPNNAGANGPNGLIIGGDTIYGEYSNCQVAVVLVYNRVLSAAEIQQNYNALVVSGRFDSLSSGTITTATRTTPLMFANVFSPYDLVSDEFGGTLFGVGQGRYMRQNTDKSVIVYNDIDEVTDLRDIVRTGLILDLDAGMNASFNNTGTTWNDLSGRGNNGTLVNGPTYSSANGGSIVFDGTNDYVDVASNASLTPTSMTLFCFLYTKNIRGEEVISCGFPSNNNGEGYRFLTCAYGGSQWQFQTSVNGNGISGSVLSNNNWYCLAVTYQSGGNIRLYLNGVLDAQVSATTALVYGTSTRIGAGLGGAQVFLQANLPVFMMYNRALTSSEVSQNYNALRNRFGL